jgi:uncharacterized protein (TIGR03435 family)
MASALALAQGQPASNAAFRPAFDVISIRLNRSGTGGAGDATPKNGTWRWTGIPLSFIVGYAYGVSLAQIQGIPGSFEDRYTAFDIVAKLPVDTPNDQFRLMLQSMLADRFKAVIHREVREVPVNTIEVAKGGAKLQRAQAPCIAPGQPMGDGPDQFRCGELATRVSQDKGMIILRYIGRSVSIRDLAEGSSANQLVLDETGIQGIYDFEVTIDYEAAPPTDEPVERQAEYQSSLKAAFEKQVGLIVNLGRLVKRPVPVVVVDHVELPDPN